MILTVIFIVHFSSFFVKFDVTDVPVRGIPVVINIRLFLFLYGQILGYHWGELILLMERVVNIKPISIVY